MFNDQYLRRFIGTILTSGGHAGLFWFLCYTPTEDENGATITPIDQFND